MVFISFCSSVPCSNDNLWKHAHPVRLSNCMYKENVFD